MTFDDFIKKWTNKICDFDNFYGGQCVDLYRQYCQEVLDFPQSPLVKGASEIWDTYLLNCFIRVDNTLEGVPNKGDIIVWNNKARGGYGHVAIFIEGTTGSFKSFDQNWPTGSICHVQSHYYTNVQGWLKPKNGSKKYTEEEMTAMRLERDANHDKYIAMKEVAEDWERKYKTEKAERESYDNFIVRIAQRLNCPAKTPDIEGVIQGLIEREDSEIKLKKEMETLNGQIKTIGIEKEELTKRVETLLDQLKAQEEAIQRLTGVAITDLTAKELFVLWFKKITGRG